MRALILVAALAASALPAGAGSVVYFEDGRAMEVERVEPDGDLVYLHLDGGGELAFPAQRVARVEPLPDPPPPIRAAAAASRHEPWRDEAGPFAELIGRASARHALDPALLTAMAAVESAFDERAVSPKGAGGLLQLMPDTAARFGVSDVFDPEQNVEGGARYMRWLLERFDGDTRLALAGYNAGEGAVDRHDGVPPYRETRDYVARVLQGLDRLAVR